MSENKYPWDSGVSLKRHQSGRCKNLVVVKLHPSLCGCTNLFEAYGMRLWCTKLEEYVKSPVCFGAKKNLYCEFYEDR